MKTYNGLTSIREIIICVSNRDDDILFRDIHIKSQRKSNISKIWYMILRDCLECVDEMNETDIEYRL